MRGSILGDPFNRPTDIRRGHPESRELAGDIHLRWTTYGNSRVHKFDADEGHKFTSLHGESRVGWMGSLVCPTTSAF